LTCEQNRYWPVVRSILRKITHELSFEEQLAVTSPGDGGAQDSSAISDIAAGKNGEPGDAGGGNENKGSGTNGNRESGGQQNQNNTEPGGSYGHDSNDNDHNNDIDMSLSTLSSSDTPTALGEDDNEDQEPEKIDSDQFIRRLALRRSKCAARLPWP